MRRHTCDRDAVECIVTRCSYSLLHNPHREARMRCIQGYQHIIGSHFRQSIGCSGPKIMLQVQISSCRHPGICLVLLYVDTCQDLSLAAAELAAAARGMRPATSARRAVPHVVTSYQSRKPRGRSALSAAACGSPRRAAARAVRTTFSHDAVQRSMRSMARQLGSIFCVEPWSTMNRLRKCMRAHAHQ